MKNSFLPALVLLAGLFFAVGSAAGHPHILHLEKGENISFSELLDNLQASRVIFMGETHDHPGHHQAQLAVIRALHRAGKEVAIGLEMFRRRSQQSLDRWVAGEIQERQFAILFSQNWQWWPQYRPIFRYAQENHLKLLALNIPREITAQVAREGFTSLRPEQVQALGPVTCQVDPVYEDFIRRALGSHGHQGKENFTHFCEAQLLWDTAMAQRLRAYLEEHPEATVVVLAGSGHSWKYGIPARLDLPAARPKVVLPETPGRLNRQEATPADADYLWLDTGPEGWRSPTSASIPLDKSR